MYTTWPSCCISAEAQNSNPQPLPCCHTTVLCCLRLQPLLFGHPLRKASSRQASQQTSFPADKVHCCKHHDDLHSLRGQDLSQHSALINDLHSSNTRVSTRPQHAFLTAATCRTPTVSLAHHVMCQSGRQLSGALIHTPRCSEHAMQTEKCGHVVQTLKNIHTLSQCACSTFMTSIAR